MIDSLLDTIALLAWGVFFLFLLVVIIRAIQTDGPGGVPRAIFSARVLIVLFIVIAISLLSASLVFIEPQEVGVVISIVSRDGYREQPLRSGLHWIAPLAERVERYPIYWQNYTMSNDPLEGSKIGDDSIAARTSDGQAVFLDASVIFRIDGNQSIRIHIDLQDRYIEDFVRPVLRGVVRSEVSQFTVDEVNSSKRIILESNLQERLDSTFSEKGFILDRFILRNIGFSPEYASAVEQKQVAEQDRIQRQFQAEQVRNLAQGEKDRLRIEAEGAADAIVLEGQAEASVILLKAQAEAEALRLINEVLEQNSELITFRYVEKLGEGIQVMLVPSDNPFLLPLPDLTDNLNTGQEAELEATIGITDTVTATETLTPTPVPTISP